MRYLLINVLDKFKLAEIISIPIPFNATAMSQHALRTPKPNILQDLLYQTEMTIKRNFNL